MSTRSLLFAIVAAVVTTLPAASQPPPSGRAPVVPARLEQLDPAVIRLIERNVAEAAADPDDPRDHAGLGMIYEGNGLLPEARESFQNAVDLAGPDPAIELWRLHLAIIAREMGDPATALTLLAELARDLPARRWPDLPPSPDLPPVHQRLGEARLEIGDLDGAWTSFERFVALRPRAAEGYAGLGGVLVARHEFARAIKRLVHAVALDPTYRLAHQRLGLAYRGLGRHQDAARELDRGAGATVRFVPDLLTKVVENFAVDLTSQLERAAAYLQARRYEHAVGVLQECRIDHGENTTVLNQLGVAYLRVGALERSREALLAALEIDGEEILTHLNLASLGLRAERPDEALAYADGVLQRAPEVARAHLTRALALGDLDRFEEALESVQKALELDPSDPRHHGFLADMATKLGRFGLAEERYKSALALYHDHMSALYGLGSLYVRQGRLEEARGVLAEGRRLAPRHPAVRELAQLLEAGPKS